MKRDEICEHCKELWGEDRQDDCQSPCTCAAHVRQDYVYQREIPIGLPAPRSLETPKKQEKTEPWYKNLPRGTQKRVAMKLGDLSKTIDPALFQMLCLLVAGHTKAEICEIMHIDSRTYDKYAEDLRENGAD